MTKLGVALLGLDHWYVALSLAPAVAASEQVRLVAVSHSDRARAEQVARDHGAELATCDDQAALDRPDVSIVLSFYSSDRNVEVCRAAAAAGKHLIAVKPMAMDLAGAQAIAEAVRAAGVHYLPFECSHRLRPESQRIKRWIEEGRIGRPLRYWHTLHSGLPAAWPGSKEHGWWLDPARVPGGGWLDHSIYAVDTVRWLFGQRPASVQGVVANQRHLDLPLEDYGCALYSLDGGAQAQIEDSWTAEPGFFFTRSEIVGSAGAILDDTRMTGRIQLRGDFGFEGWLSLEQQGSSGALIVEHMASCLREQSQPIATIDDALINHASCLAFYQAASQGRRLPIEL